MTFKSYLLQNSDNTYTMNTRVVSGEINVAGGVSFAVTNIPKAVYLEGISALPQQVNQGAIPKVKLADITNLATFPILGLLVTAGAQGALTSIITNGFAVDFDTSGFSNGDVLFLSTNGDLTATRPKEDLVVQVGVVIVSDSNNGVIQVNIQEYPNPEVYSGFMSQYGLATNIGITLVDTDSKITGMIAGPLRNFTFQNGSELVCTKAGLYTFNWSLSETDGNNRIFEGGIAIDGIRDDSSVASRKLGNNDLGSQGGTLQRVLAIGEIVSMVVRNTTDDNDMTVLAANLGLHRLGP